VDHVDFAVHFTGEKAQEVFKYEFSDSFPGLKADGSTMTGLNNNCYDNAVRAVVRRKLPPTVADGRFSLCPFWWVSSNMRRVESQLYAHSRESIDRKEPCRHTASRYGVLCNKQMLEQWWQQVKAEDRLQYEAPLILLDEAIKLAHNSKLGIGEQLSIGELKQVAEAFVKWDFKVSPAHDGRHIEISALLHNLYNGPNVAAHQPLSIKLPLVAMTFTLDDGELHIFSILERLERHEGTASRPRLALEWKVENVKTKVQELWTMERYEEKIRVKPAGPGQFETRRRWRTTQRRVPLNPARPQELRNADSQYDIVFSDFTPAA
jgi:hypothetical protein